MPSRKLDFPVFDADNHMYETPDAFTKYLPAEYEGLIKYVEVNGRTKIAVKNLISDFIPNPTFERVAAPGAQEEYFKVGNPDGKSRKEILGRGIDALPGFSSPAPRLVLMDELGIDRALMWPTLASLLEERIRDDPPAVHAVVHALNQWMAEHWTFNYENRMFPTPVIHLGLVDRAIEELDWVLERGAQDHPDPAGPGHGVPGTPVHRPARVRPVLGQGGRGRHPGRDARLRQRLPAVHERVGGRPRRGDDAVQGGLGVPGHHRPPGPPHHRHGGIAHRARPCTRFPTLRFTPVENGSNWVRPLLNDMEHAWEFSPNAFEENPVDVFKRNIYVHPFHEEDPKGLIEILGADRVLFGSDYPHPEGMSDPISFVDELKGLPEDDVRLIMGGNLNRLMGFAEAAA